LCAEDCFSVGVASFSVGVNTFSVGVAAFLVGLAKKKYLINANLGNSSRETPVFCAEDCFSVAWLVSRWVWLVSQWTWLVSQWAWLVSEWAWLK
jgi:hypothetical protein